MTISAKQRVYLFFALVYGAATAIHGQNVSPQLWLEKALEQAAAITNIEIQYDDFYWRKGIPEAPPFTNDFERTQHVTWISSGNKYWTEGRFESPTRTNLIKSMQEAFDGKLWSGFNGSSMMAQQDGDMPGSDVSATCPLILPFLFLSRRSDDHILCGLRFTDLRSGNILNGLVLPDAKSSNGTIHLTFDGLPMYGVNQLWSVDLDEADPDFKPKQISVTFQVSPQRNFTIKSIYTLSDYTNVCGYHFPMKIARADYRIPTNTALAPILDSTGTVTVVSLKLPAAIPESTFRLDESKAQHIWNTGMTKGYGVGLLLREEGTNIVVGRIVLDSPAGRQDKIHAGDRVVSITEPGTKPVMVHAGKADLPRAGALLRGKKGTVVSIAFIPGGKDSSQTEVVDLERGEEKSHLGNVGKPLVKGMEAPKIEMLALTNRATEHLSDFAGKVVVLEFWASWCSPCQKSMADLQLEAARHPKWKDKVVLVAASVDDTADIATKHAQKNVWNQTHNVWLKTRDIKPYNVGYIPFFYVIDSRGNITTVPKPLGEKGPSIAEAVDQCLDASQGN